jgi:hydroxyacylglutathione hydrolase
MPAEITPGLGQHLVLRFVTGEAWRENCYLVTHTPSGEMALVDPGDNADSIILAVLENGKRLQHILLTHAHHDHVGAVAALCRKFDLACYVHKHDVRLLRHAPMYAMLFARKHIEPPAPFRVLENEPKLRLAERAIQVIHTPGHTFGSVCYEFGGFVFTGDTLLYKQVGRTDLPGGDAKSLAASVSWLTEHLPGETIVFPGHGRPWTLGEAKNWWQEGASSRSNTETWRLEGSDGH